MARCGHGSRSGGARKAAARSRSRAMRTPQDALACNFYEAMAVADASSAKAVPRGLLDPLTAPMEVLRRHRPSRAPA